MDENTNTPELGSTKVKRSHAVFGIGQVDLPPTLCDVIFNEVTFKKSQSGNPMWKIKGEIIAPASVQVGDKTVTLAGQKFFANAMLTAEDPWGIANVYNGLDLVGFDYEAVGWTDPEDGEPAIDIMTPEVLNNFQCSMLLLTKRQVLRDAQRQEYKDANGDPILGEAQIEGVGGINAFSWIRGPVSEESQVSVPDSGM